MIELLARRRGMGEVKDDPIIEFDDSNVKAKCVSGYGGATGGSAPTSYRIGGVKVIGKAGEITYKQAESVLTFPQGTTGIFLDGTYTSFNELQYFTHCTKINSKAFQASTFSGTITFPSSLTSIGSKAFYSLNCPRLIFLSTTPPTMSDFAQTNHVTRVYVPDESVDTYKTAWSSWASKIKSINELST